MSGSKNPGYEVFDQLISALRADGYSAEADRLRVMLHEVAWTTSSELLGELGREIVSLQRINQPWSAQIQERFLDCMALVRRVWPAIGS